MNDVKAYWFRMVQIYKSWRVQIIRDMNLR